MNRTAAQPRPQTIPEAQRIIKNCFRRQGRTGWDADDQRRYFKMIGVEGMEKPDDVRRIFDDLLQAKMI